MNDDQAFLAFVKKSFEHDIAGAAYLLESLPKADAEQIFQALPVEVAVRAIRRNTLASSMRAAIDNTHSTLIKLDIA